ncbi:hypothetical protein B7494_g7988 [Chlorociboria aeruginascens]|nr:hypothetical protein B7494_g7988 [Chlorociboria aeruginascens]
MLMYFNSGNDERARYGGQNSYYGRQSYRPESTYMDGKSNGMTRPDSYYNTGDNVGPSNGYYPNRARYPARTASEPHISNGQGVYPLPGNQQSYETVTTASGSGSSADPAGYSTDPSSENSSVDRIAPLPVPPKEPAETYGFNGFGNSPQFVPPGAGLPGDRFHGGQQGYDYGPPPVPRKQVNPQSPIKLGSTGNSPTSPEIQSRPPAAEKRKSWLSKRFSRS